MPAIGDKIWVSKGGLKWAADVSHVHSDTVVDANLHGSLRQHPTSGALVDHHEPDAQGNHMIVGGMTSLKLATTDSEKSADGAWWPRGGKFTTNAAGRREWAGE